MFPYYFSPREIPYESRAGGSHTIHYEPPTMRTLNLLLCLLLASSAVAQESYELSYLLVRKSDGQNLAAQQSDQPRTPASTMKLITAAAALETLGPEHRYQTTVHLSNLSGNLSLKGEADPELTQATLDELAALVKESGLRRVEGDLLVDEGPFAFPPYGEGWAWDDAGASYSPEVTGLAVDGGVVEVPAGAPWLHPVPGEGDSAVLIPGREGVAVQGAPPQSLAAPDSALHAGALFKEALRKHGIEVQGQVRRGSAEGQEIAVHQSRTLEQILHQALVDSDNLAMELVGRSSGSALPSELKEQPLRRADGSGLSRYNLISARQLVKTLLAHPELVNLVPGPGEGTLKKRFLDGPAKGKVRAKTGTLGNVSSLAGYLFPGTPNECVFAIMINGHLGSTAERKEIENRLVQEWAERYADLPFP